MATKRVEKLYALVQGIKTAMMTTRRRDGHLVSRPMATQKPAPGADFWFATEVDSDKVREIARDPHVNLTYYKDRTREWVSVSGTAQLVTDRRKVRALWAPDWKAWFGDEGGERDGSAEDPRIGLIAVKVHTAMFLDETRPQPVVLFELAKALATGGTPRMGKVRTVTGAEMHRRRSR